MKKYYLYFLFFFSDIMDPWQVESIQNPQETSDNYCLRWNDFESNSIANLKYRFRELRDDSEFYDVTLCCDNGTDIIPAHKKILSACSPLFCKILSRQKTWKNQENTFLYLKGIHLKEVKAVITFMYKGEVNVAQDSLSDFLAVAEELAIKGLATDSKPADTDTPELKAQKRSLPPGSSSTSQAAKNPKLSQSSAVSEALDIKSFKTEPEPSGSGAYLDDESYDAGGDGGDVQKYDFYQEGNGFDESFGTAGGSSAGADGKRQRKSYNIDIKLNAIREAERTSNREVARVLGADEATVRHWRKHEQQLIQSKAQGGTFRSKGGGRKVRDSLLEQILSEWHSERTSSGIKVTGSMLKKKAHGIAVETGSEMSRFSDGWLSGFTKRYGIALDNKNKATPKAHKEIELMERILYDWLLQQQSDNAGLSGQIVRAKAEELCKACTPDVEYNFSLGWLDGFKKRYKVRLHDRPGDRALPAKSSTSADPLDVKPFPNFFVPPRM